MRGVFVNRDEMLSKAKNPFLFFKKRKKLRGHVVLWSYMLYRRMEEKKKTMEVDSNNVK